jgi:uncharacterized protein (TIRG00374 family)
MLPAHPQSLPEGEGTHAGRRWLWTLLGLLLVIGLAVQLGDRALLEQVAALGWWAGLLPVPYALFCLLDVKGWQCVFPQRRVAPSLARLYAIRLAGEAINDFTPTGSVGGEPVKALLLRRHGVPTADAIVSLIVGRTALTAGQILFILLGFAILVARFEANLRWGAALAVLCVAAYLFVATIVGWQRRGVVTSVTAFLARLVGAGRLAERWADGVRNVDQEMAAFYARRPGAFALSIGLHLASWLLGALELAIFVWLLDRPVHWLDVVVVDALVQPVKLAGLVVPGALGVQEAGGVLAFSLVGIDAGTGFAVMVLRRLRELFFGGAGALLLRSLARGERAPPQGED